MKNKHLFAVIFGPQGSGKGTQGSLLSDRFYIPLIGAGDLFRAEIQQKSTLGNLIGQYVSQGLLAPDELVNAVLTRQLKFVDLTRGFILDGYPRNVDQAAYLDRLLPINLAIQIKLSESAVLKRLKGRLQCTKCKTIYHETESPPIKNGVCSLCDSELVKREDDIDEIIKQRLKAYNFITSPLAGYYRQRGVLLPINGEQPIQYVFEDILKKISKLGFNS